MIDTSTERILTLTEAAAELPRRRGGKKTSTSCLYRWTVSGCRGVVLECVQIGGTRATSREALARFFDRLTQASVGPSAPTGLRSPSKRQRDDAAADKLLKEMGA